MGNTVHTMHCMYIRMCTYVCMNNNMITDYNEFLLINPTSSTKPFYLSQIPSTHNTSTTEYKCMEDNLLGEKGEKRKNGS